MDNKNIVVDINSDNLTTNENGNITIAESLDFSTPINYIKTREDAIEPTRGSAEAAGYDLYIPREETGLTVPAHGTIKVGTGIAVAIPKGTFGAIFARSGLATKVGLRPANCVGE